VIGSQLLRQGGLLGPPRDGGDPVAQLGGVLQAEVAQAADPLHGDQRTRAAVDPLQRLECRETGAQQRRRLHRRQTIGNPHQAAAPRVDDLGVPAVHGPADLRLVEAVDEIAPPAGPALVALTTEVAHADPLTDLPTRHTVADRIDDADDLVAGNDGLAGVGAKSLGGDRVSVTDAATLDSNPDMVRGRVAQLAIDERELPSAGDFIGTIGGHHSPHTGSVSRRRCISVRIAASPFQYDRPS
jgi:hypothetical protein